MWPFQKAKREQTCLIFCEDRKIDEAPLPIEKAYMLDEKTTEAWHLVHSLLLPYQEIDGRLVALISERDAVPLSPFGSLSAVERARLKGVNKIAREEMHKQLQQIESDNRQHLIASAVKFTILVIAVLFSLVVLVNLFSSGNISMPWTG